MYTNGQVLECSRTNKTFAFPWVWSGSALEFVFIDFKNWVDIHTGCSCGYRYSQTIMACWLAMSWKKFLKWWSAQGVEVVLSFLLSAHRLYPIVSLSNLCACGRSSGRSVRVQLDVRTAPSLLLRYSVWWFPRIRSQKFQNLSGYSWGFLRGRHHNQLKRPNGS